MALHGHCNVLHDTMIAPRFSAQHLSNAGEVWAAHCSAGEATCSTLQCRCSTSMTLPCATQYNVSAAFCCAAPQHIVVQVSAAQHNAVQTRCCAAQCSAGEEPGSLIAVLAVLVRGCLAQCSPAQCQSPCSHADCLMTVMQPMVACMHVSGVPRCCKGGRGQRSQSAHSALAQRMQ